MKKLILMVLLLVVFSGESTIGETQDFQEFVKDVKKKIVIERSYKIETEENLVLAPGRATRLDFEDNPAGVKEFIFFYDDEIVHIIYRCTDDSEKEYNSTSLDSKKLKDYRGICATGAAKYLNIFSAWKPKDGKAFIEFRTTMSLSEKDREELKEIDEARRRRKVAELQAISELEWDFREKIKPVKLIMDDPNDPNMVKLRNEYDLEGLVSSAKDDYEKLRLIAGWVQKQWRHSGNNKPSKSDPLTILKEASEGKRFRCVEYAKVVAACARSLGMPSRTLGLKRPDVETAKSGAGHVVAEVWLEQFNKWVFVDSQWGAIPERDGVPLNTVEFQDAIARELPGLKINFNTKVDRTDYLTWVARYLYYFDFNLDQRFYNGETEEERISGSKGKIMLVPKGAKKPKVFQIKYPIKNCTYISNPKTFYPQMSKALAITDAKKRREQSNIDCSNVMVTSCDMDVRVFPEEHLLKVKAGLDLSSNKKGMTDLGFVLREEFDVKKISQGHKNLKFTQEGWKIKVEGVEIGDDALPLAWEYEGKFEPPYEHDSMSNVIVYSDEIRLTRSSHWYPEPEWSSDEKKITSSRLSVEVPAAFVVVSGDNLDRKTQTTDGRVRYQYFSKTHGSLSFAASEYVQTTLRWGDKTVEAYFFKKKPEKKPKLIVTQIPHEEEDVFEILKASKSILDFYSKHFTPYPWNRFALVQKSNYAAYAYGVNTYVVMNNLSFYSERSLAHEIAHQWWGNMIHPVGEGERWLTESLAEYSAFLYMEHVHGRQKQVVPDRRESLLSWMQQMSPIRQASFDTPNYNNIVYKIGPHIFHMLRYITSDELFFDILRIFSKEYAYKDATVDNFIEVAESIYQKGMSWFFEQWLDRTKNPEFVLESEIALQGYNAFLVKGNIIQHNTDFRMPLEIEITGDERKEKRTIWVEGNQTAFSYRLPYQPLTVKFVEEMPYWILADFFNNEEERLAVAEKRPKPRPSREKEELIALIRNNIKFEQAYEPGTEIELELGEKEAVRLELAENPSGVKEIFICPMEGSLFFVRLHSDGGSSIGGKSLARGEAFYYTRAANIARWEVRDEKVHIKFRAEAEREKIIEALREVYFKKKGMTEEEIEKRLKQLFP